RTHPLRLKFSVPERDAAAIRVGQVTRIRVEGDPVEHTGRVVRLSPVFEKQNRTLTVEAEVENRQGRLRAGSFATAEILVDAHQPVVLAPASAIVTFAGVTRDHNDGPRVRGLAYEAYVEMAESLMTRILDEVAARHAIGTVRVRHRLGAVPIGEASVIVVVGAPHRGPAFDACREIMDRLKNEVPIFKREELDAPGGGSRWVGELPRESR
ncbi:MAG: molybdenum cofactor biosynthesis protein MoaE, partial [Planctomycetes bacterium]|nr:molybdenum cofactor biosynthesis protein MoaE [Planctomycetota bacterium]